MSDFDPIHGRVLTSAEVTELLAREMRFAMPVNGRTDTLACFSQFLVEPVVAEKLRNTLCAFAAGHRSDPMDEVHAALADAREAIPSLAGLTPVGCISALTNALTSAYKEISALRGIAGCEIGCEGTDD